MKILVTGARGFLGRNLIVALRRNPDHVIYEYDLDSLHESLEAALASADVIYHLAGVNRPRDPDEFISGNVEFTAYLCNTLSRLGRDPTLIFTSSVQAASDNPYGLSKRKAEEILADFGRSTGAKVAVFRLPGVFGKWCRPNYNSVVATFCNNIARGIPIAIKDPAREIDLVHIDDVVKAFIDIMETKQENNNQYCEIQPVFRVTVSRLAELLTRFKAGRTDLMIPDFSDPFIRRLYSTYISYIPESEFAYSLPIQADARGELAEFLKSVHFGQIFVSRTRPGIVRGHHYHDLKVEKFAVLEGQAIIRFRSIQGDDPFEYRVSGREFRVVDIPPGYTHSIKNIGNTDMVVLFWAFEPYDPIRPDIYSLNVEKDKQA